MSILVSVIIPTHNCEAYIAETINCVLAQDYPNIELLIIDDGSTDKTKDIVKSYGDKIKLINQENAGVCVARNHGIREASGDYLCLMDHDDYWYPNKISKQVSILNTQPDIGVVYSEFTLWYPNSTGHFPSPEKFNNQLPETKTETDIDHEFSGWIYHLLLLDCWVLTSTAMFRADTFNTCGLFDETLPYSEDWDLWLRISREYQFVKLHEATTLYRQHLNQGNRKIRSIDYRTALLIAAQKKWGLSSPDGRSISAAQFNRQLAEYHIAYGLHHLQVSNRVTATVSFLKAWALFPSRLKCPIYIIVGAFGWKPVW